MFINYKYVVDRMDYEVYSNIMMETTAKTLQAFHPTKFEDDENSEGKALKRMAKIIQEFSQ